MNEMAFETGLNDKNNYQGKTDWEFYNKPENKKFVKLLKDKIGSNKYKFYKVPGVITSYFLTDENDNYLGRIQLEVINNKGYIKTSHGSIKNFYKIMFTLLLTEVKEIYSDVSLSTQAIKSYEKLSKNGLYKIKIKDTDNNIHDFDKDLLLQYPGNVVQITEKQEGFIEEHFKDYYKRISLNQVNGRPDTFKRMFLESDEYLDLFLFGQM